jgi:acyl-CoA synthetase (AMP-forming)/AMP-acid ligase II
MSEFNLADSLDVVADACGEREALIQGERTLLWRELRTRCDNIAGWMKKCGASHQAKVAVYTYNHTAYMEACYAAMKAALVPVNVNYRYREEELRYLLDNADAEIVVVHEEFAPLLDKVAGDLPQLKGVLSVSDSGARPRVGGLTVADFETVAATPCALPPIDRSPDDLLFLYTGGTTGMPKGVMWRQGDLYRRLAGAGLMPPPETLDGLREVALSQPIKLRTLIGPPLMHGTGWFTGIIAWLGGGTVILLDNPKHFDAGELWSTVERTKATTVTLVGDSFGKPLLRELESNPGKYDLSSLAILTSSGVMWSEPVKQGLLQYVPQAMLIDAFSSSEAVGMGMSITTAAGTAQTGKFELSDKTRLFDENLRPIETSPGVKGLVGVGGSQPIGYYKDPQKSARTFIEADGGRYSVPGDWAQVNDDGKTLTLLGRGSVCINTGGEKVFPEEVEEVIKRFPGVKDVVVVGVPDERFGEAITAVVSSLGAALDENAIKAFVKEHLASYKAPKHVVVVDDVYRSPSGKADFKKTKEVAMAALSN